MMKFTWRQILLAAACVAALVQPATAQRESIPTQTYYNIFPVYHDGEYDKALKGFLAEGRGSIKGVNGRWIDAICYHTMAGECYYQMGRYPQALEQYTSALTLFHTYNDWLLRVQFPPSIRPAAAGEIRPCAWGKSGRTAKIGEYPGHIMMSRGQINNNQKLQQGGVFESPALFPITAAEIVRCTTISMRRRRELLGPACAYDPLNADIAAALARRPIAPNHWSEAWMDVLQGLAYAGVGNDGEARALLQRGLIAGGEFDHQFTATALFEIGRISLAAGDFPGARKFFEEASFSANQFLDVSLLEESLRQGYLAHLLAGGKEIYPLLEPAASWARVKGNTQMRASLTLCAAENAAALGQTKDAIGLLNTARTTVGNREMGKGKIGLRSNYLNALTLYQQGKVDDGDAALAGAISFLKSGGSLWLYQIGLADSLFVEGKIEPRNAMSLYGGVLREPQPNDWLIDPLESLAVLVTPHPQPIDHWFEVALTRKEFERALEISDAARRHRFLSSLPFGGRLLGLRWMMEGPDEVLTPQGILQRQDLRARYPAFAQISQNVKQLQADLARIPLVPDDSSVQRSQAEQLAKLAEVSLTEEALLREIAIRREPASLVFPPQRSVKDIQKALPEGHAVLAFFATGTRLYGCLMSKEKYPIWEIGAVNSLKTQISAMLREMGHFESNSVVPLATLVGDGWKRPARQVVDMLLKGSKEELPGAFEELVVVPDGLLWYLPFEALPVGDPMSPQPLIIKSRVRYAPFIAAAIPDQRGKRQSAVTGVVVGRLMPGGDESLSTQAFEQISRSIRGTFALRKPMPAPSSILVTQCDRLVVLDDLVPGESGGLNWSPLTLDRGAPGSDLESWLPLPFGAPDQIVLPGFHTAAENALKPVKGGVQNGTDVFLSVCGLMASGSRTVLMSRWRTGGQSSYNLMQEFVQELPHTTAANAWQRSVLLVRDAPINFEHEPRVKAGPNDSAPNAANPFFWSGYLLVDSGAAAFKADVPAAEKAVKADP